MARTVIEELVTVFGFETDKEGARAALRTYTDLHHAARDLVNIARRAASALLEPLTNVVRLGEAAFLTGKRLGMTAEEVQALDTVARLTGVSGNALVRVMEHLNISAAKTGTRFGVLARDGFGRLGVSVRDQNGHLKTSSQLFFDTLVRISEIPEAGRRARIAFQLMGEQAGRVMPLLAMGPGYLLAVKDAAAEAGAILSNDTAAAARDLSFWWQLLELRTEGFEKRLGTGLIPIAQKVVGTMLMLWTANKKIVDQRIDVIVNHATGAVYGFAKVLRSTVSVFEDVIKLLGGFDTALTFVEIILGVTLLGALGAATAAVIRFGVSLLFANAVPLLLGATFGVLLGVIALVVQDLKSTNSLLTELGKTPWLNPDDAPIVRLLKRVLQLMNGIERAFTHKSDLLTVFGGAFDFTKSQEGFLQAQGRDAMRGAPRIDRSVAPPGFLEKLDINQQENKLRLFEGSFWSDFVTGLGERPQAMEKLRGTASVGYGAAGGRFRDPGGITIEVQQTFNGPADPAAVKTATTAGVTTATEDTRLQQLYDAVRSGHN